MTVWNKYAYGKQLSQAHTDRKKQRLCKVCGVRAVVIGDTCQKCRSLSAAKKGVKVT